MLHCVKLFNIFSLTSCAYLHVFTTCVWRDVISCVSLNVYWPDITQELILYFTIQGGLTTKKRAVDFYKKGINELETGLQISCDEEGTSVFKCSWKRISVKIDLSQQYVVEVHIVVRGNCVYQKKLGGLMVSALDVTLNDAGSIAGWGYFVCVLGQDIKHSHRGSLHPYVFRCWG